jgi:hypothetical protein
VPQFSPLRELKEQETGFLPKFCLIATDLGKKPGFFFAEVIPNPVGKSRFPEISPRRRALFV